MLDGQQTALSSRSLHPVWTYFLQNKVVLVPKDLFTVLTTCMSSLAVTDILRRSSMLYSGCLWQIACSVVKVWGHVEQTGTLKATFTKYCNLETIKPSPLNIYLPFELLSIFQGLHWQICWVVTDLKCANILRHIKYFSYVYMRISLDCRLLCYCWIY